MNILNHFINLLYIGDIGVYLLYLLEICGPQAADQN